jgi:hypothetical protein
MCDPPMLSHQQEFQPEKERSRQISARIGKAHANGELGALAFIDVARAFEAKPFTESGICDLEGGLKESFLRAQTRTHPCIQPAQSHRVRFNGGQISFDLSRQVDDKRHRLGRASLRCIGHPGQ